MISQTLRNRRKPSGLFLNQYAFFCLILSFYPFLLRTPIAATPQINLSVANIFFKITFAAA